MITRRSLVGAGILAPLAAKVSANPMYYAGKQYLFVEPPVPAPAQKIEIVKFFAYTCPHCLRFETVFDEWAKTLPDDVTVRVCPVAWQPKLLPFTDTYFALEALDRMDLSQAFFESVVYQTHSYDFESAVDDIADFMASKGLDRQRWLQTVNSFGVKNKSRQATQLWQEYGIDSTPMVGVDGLYSTGPHLVGSREGVPDCLNFLIAQARKARAKRSL